MDGCGHTNGASVRPQSGLMPPDCARNGRAVFLALNMLVATEAGGIQLTDYTAFIVSGSFVLDIGPSIALGPGAFLVSCDKNDVTGETMHSALLGVGVVSEMYLGRRPGFEFYVVRAGGYAREVFTDGYPDNGGYVRSGGGDASIETVNGVPEDVSYGRHRAGNAAAFILSETYLPFL